MDSQEGLTIIDNWVDKWGYILRSLKKKTDNFYFDLSGGFDTRIILSIMLNSNIDLDNIYIKSTTDSLHGHDEDFQIASNISSKYGFKLNNFNLDNNCSIWNIKDSIALTLYTKLGFHKEFYLKECFFNRPRFGLTGAGGEIIRGSPGYKINHYIDSLSLQANKIKEYKIEFYNSSKKICFRSVHLLKNEKIYRNDYEISSALYSKGRARNHFGKLAVEGFLSNIYSLQPLMDPDLKKIKYDINGSSSHDLIAYIYKRFSQDLINFKFQGNRTLNPESVKKAENLIGKISPYKIKSNYNKFFFIDNNRKSPVSNSKNNITADEYLKELFKTHIFIDNVFKVYNQSIYNWAKEYSKKTNYYPLRHGFGLLAIAITIELLSINKKYLKKINNFSFLEEKKILNYLIK